MAGTALAATSDIELRMGSVDASRAQAAIDDASALIHAETRGVWVDGGELVDDVPAVALTICCKIVQRVLTNPDEVTSETLGPFSQTRSGASADVYLTRSERRVLRRAAGINVGSVTLESPYETPLDRGTLYAPDASGGDDIPMIRL